MKDFGDIDNTVGSYPSAEAVDSTTPTSLDGTPYNQDVLNDLWGAFQAVLSTANVTPSGDIETYEVSDFMDSLHQSVGHPGEVILWAGAVQGDGVAYVDSQGSPGDPLVNLVELAGQELEIQYYPKLAAAVWVGPDPVNADTDIVGFYKVTDPGGGSPVRDENGTFLKLPDCRGKFLRATDTTGSRDEDRNGGQHITLQRPSPGNHTHYSHPKIPDVAPGTEDGNYFQFGSLGIATPTQGSDYEMIIGTDFEETPSEPGLDKGVDVQFPDLHDTTFNGTTEVSSEEVRPVNVNFRLMVRF